MISAEFFLTVGVQFNHLEAAEETVANIRIWMGGIWETRPTLCWEGGCGFCFWCGIPGMAYHSLWWTLCTLV